MGHVNSNPRTNGREVDSDSQWVRAEVGRQLVGANQSNQPAAIGTQCVWNFLEPSRHLVNCNQWLSITCVHQELCDLGALVHEEHSMLEVHSGKKGTPNQSVT